MSTRRLTSPAAALSAAVLVVALVLTAGAAMRHHAVTTERPVEAAATPQADSELSRVSEVPTSAGARKQIRVLSNGCRYSTRGIPRCGTLLGAAYGANTDPSAWESSMGHRLGVHRTYYAADEVDEAVHTARADLRHQRVPWISFKAPHSWGAMAAGAGDAWAADIAHRLAKLNGPVWIAFHHEPEGDGDITHWTAMQERLAPIVRAAAPNVAYSVILTGWNQVFGSAQFSLQSMWPKHTKIDLVGFDVYNRYGVRKDGVMSTEHTQFDSDYFNKFEKFAKKHDVAWGLAETGYTDRSATVEPWFVQHLYDHVSDHGGVAVAYFNSRYNSIASWRLKGPKGLMFASVLRETPTL